MNSNPLSFLMRQTLELTPIEGEPAFAASCGRAKFHPNTRDGNDRRSGRERRTTMRLDPDRRVSRDRRPRRGWDNGPNL